MLGKLWQESSHAANFCVLTDGAYQTWANAYYSTSNPGLTFPWSQCLTSSGQTLQTTLTFTLPSSGTWDVVAINNNPNAVTVTYSPAFLTRQRTGKLTMAKRNGLTSDH